MFLSEKIAEMVAMGSSVKEINKFKDTYSAEIIKGTAPADAMEFAEAHFGGPGSGRYPAKECIRVESLFDVPNMIKLKKDHE